MKGKEMERKIVCESCFTMYDQENKCFHVMKCDVIDCETIDVSPYYDRALCGTHYPIFPNKLK